MCTPSCSTLHSYAGCSISYGQFKLLCVHVLVTLFYLHRLLKLPILHRMYTPAHALAGCPRPLACAPVKGECGYTRPGSPPGPPAVQSAAVTVQGSRTSSGSALLWRTHGTEGCSKAAPQKAVSPRSPADIYSLHPEGVHCWCCKSSSPQPHAHLPLRLRKRKIPFKRLCSFFVGPRYAWESPSPLAAPKKKDPLQKTLQVSLLVLAMHGKAPGKETH